MSKNSFSIFPNETFVDLSLYQFGREACKPCHQFGPAARNHYLFHYVLNGTGTYAVDQPGGKPPLTYRVKSGQGFLIFPDTVTTYTADEDHPWEYIWLEFDGLRVSEVLQLSSFSKTQHLYRAKNRDIREDMVKEMEMIVENSNRSVFFLIGHLYLFLDYLIRSVAGDDFEHGSRLRDYYIHETMVFVEHNFQNAISVEDMAKNCGLSRSYFSKVFKDAVGKSPQEFLLQYRMIKATELLRLTDLLISDVGNAVGYPNQLHFSRAFKGVYGVSPREWRNAHKLE